MASSDLTHIFRARKAEDKLAELERLYSTTYDELWARIGELQLQNDLLEKITHRIRSSPDFVPAVALSQLWDMLGAKNQTQATGILKQLIGA